MKKKALLLFIIVFLGFVLRYQNYTTIPRHGATFDEFAWTWLGINLIKEHAPISWSPHPQYEIRKEIKYQGAAFLIVRPYLEHPPLFGIVAGSFALLNGVKDMYHVSLDKIRPLALILGTLSVLMIFLLMRELYGLNTALISSLLYATIPTIVIGSRIVQNENFLIPIWIFVLYLLVLYLKTQKKWLRNLVAVVSGMLILAKVPWFAVSLSLVLILAYKKKWKDSFLIIGTSIVFFSLFIAYGAYFDKELFFNLWKLQLSRYDISFIGAYSLFTKPLLVDRYFLDGWIYFGFISIFLLAKEFKSHVFILFPFMAYFLVFIFAIPDEPGHGWYRYPFYPFFIASISLFLKENFLKNHLLSFFFLTFVGLSLFQVTWVPSFGFSYAVLRIVIIVLALTLLSLFIQTKNATRLVRVISFALFLLLIFLNMWSIIIYSE